MPLTCIDNPPRRCTRASTGIPPGNVWEQIRPPSSTAPCASVRPSYRQPPSPSAGLPRARPSGRSSAAMLPTSSAAPSSGRSTQLLRHPKRTATAPLLNFGACLLGMSCGSPLLQKMNPTTVTPRSSDCYSLCVKSCCWFCFRKIVVLGSSVSHVLKFRLRLLRSSCVSFLLCLGIQSASGHILLEKNEVQFST